MSDENSGAPAPESAGVLKELPAPKPKTKEELELEAEQKARIRKEIYLRIVGKVTETEANFIIVNESHGFCNALKKYLLKNEHVLFASYKKEFGVDPSLYVNTDGKITALDALVDASDKMHVDLKELNAIVVDALKKAK
nr:RpoL/Rpb11 RNA polymerase subunit family protein [Candidatus Sigynarchaeota archaeon]